MPAALPPDARVLLALRRATLHLPTSQLAEEAQLSGVALRRSIAALSEAGFEIELRPGLGYRLLANPDRLIADDLWARLAEQQQQRPTGHLLREIIVLAETGSTNDVAAQLGRDGVASGVAILAERQTAGRGRFGRRWESAAHRGLWLSLLLRPALPIAQWPRLTTWAAVALASALERIAPCAARIKWPNDVELGGRKVAGLLAEMGHDAQGQPFVVLGLGLNVNHGVDDFPPELSARATSLQLATGRECDRAQVAVALWQELAATQGLLAEGFDQLVLQAARRSNLLGKSIEARSGETMYQGIAEELDADGHLLLRTAEGAILKLAGGEVTLRMG